MFVNVRYMSRPGSKLPQAHVPASRARSDLTEHVGRFGFVRESENPR